MTVLQNIVTPGMFITESHSSFIACGVIMWQNLKRRHSSCRVVYLTVKKQAIKILLIVASRFSDTRLHLNWLFIETVRPGSQQAYLAVTNICLLAVVLVAGLANT